MEKTTETIDKLYLELSQFTTAKTRREIQLERIATKHDEVMGALARFLNGNCDEDELAQATGLNNHRNKTHK